MGAAFEESMALEVARILSDPAFKRAPVQSALLNYLGEQSCSSNARKLTQYDIAVEGLGKHTNFDESQDCSVRVQISRLRSSLESYYSRNEPIGEGCVYIRPGDYMLRIGSRSIAYPKLRQPEHHPKEPIVVDENAGRRIVGDAPIAAKFGKHLGLAKRPTFALGGLFMLGIGALISLAPKDISQPRVNAALDRQFVSYEVSRVGFATNRSEFEELENATKATVETTLSRSIITHPANVGARNTPTYTFKILFDLDSEGVRYAELKLEDSQNRTIHQERREIPLNPHDATELLQEEIASIFAPPGVFSRHLARKIPEQPRNAYECLILIEVGPSQNSRKNELIQHCSDRFRQSEYLPFIEARQLFWAFQDERLKTGEISEGSSHWNRLLVLLNEYPDNPYLNTLAAKALLGQGECLTARRYVNALLQHRRLYPALEMMIATEISGCDLTETEWSNWKDRTVSIADANLEPHAMLQLYELTALLTYSQSEKAASLPPAPFTQADSPAMAQLISALRDSAVNRTAISDQSGIEAVVWNDNALSHLRAVSRGSPSEQASKSAP